MSQTPQQPKGGAPAPATAGGPGAKPAAPGQKPAAPPARRGDDKVETKERNIFSRGREYAFNPTPVKPHTTEVSSPSLPAPPSRPARSGGTPSQTRSPSGSGGGHPVADRQSAAFLMPGAGQPATPEPKKPAGPAQKPAQPAAQKPTTTKPAQPAAKPAAPPPKAAAPAAPGGAVNAPDKLGYQGKLPVFVGKPQDGNPMVDGEDASFYFDPKTHKVSIECKVASIMLKAACLHLGLPAPERGPRRFTLRANLKPDVVEKHKGLLFDANLEIRLTAQDGGRPVLLDLTLYEGFTLTPEL